MARTTHRTDGRKETSGAKETRPPATVAANRVEMPATARAGDSDLAVRAYLKWLGRGAPQNDDQRDWFEAEAELRAAAAQQERGL